MHFVKRDYKVGDRLSVKAEKCKKTGIYIGHAEIVYYDELRNVVAKESIGEFTLSGTLENITDKYASQKNIEEIIASAIKIINDKLTFNNVSDFINYCI